MSSNSPSRGDIYWADLRPEKGSEQGGFRPVLVISNNLMNMRSSVVLAIPMTSVSEKSNAGPFNVPYKGSDCSSIEAAIKELKEKGHQYVAGSDGTILCNQSRAISKQRMIIKVGAFTNKQVLSNVKTALIDSFGLDSCEGCGFPVRGPKCGKCGRIHKRKCSECGSLFDLLYNFCPRCGKGV